MCSGPAPRVRPSRRYGGRMRLWDGATVEKGRVRMGRSWRRERGGDDDGRAYRGRRARVRLISRSWEVRPEEADEGTLRVYEGVRERLRVPFVNFLFRMLANYPAYLDLAWGKLEPYLLSRRFELAADELRARALPEPVPELAGADWDGLGDLERIRLFTDTIHYVLPKLLLVASAFDEGLGGAPGAEGCTPENVVSPGVAEGTIALPMIASEEAAGKTRRIFEEIRERHGHPGVASYYRAIGRWPEFLEAAWERVGPLVGSVPYEETKRGLLERSQEVVGEFPLTRANRQLDQTHMSEAARYRNDL